MDLRDRVIVITGASSGVGRALALELAHRTARWYVGRGDRELATEGR